MPGEKPRRPEYEPENDLVEEQAVAKFPSTLFANESMSRRRQQRLACHQCKRDLATHLTMAEAVLKFLGFGICPKCLLTDKRRVDCA